jgi:hypothetical protein
VNERASAICVDTGVLTASLRAGSALEARYRRHLTGRRLVIATQVVAEARFGALRAGWGERRLTELERLLRTAVVAATQRGRSGTPVGCVGPEPTDSDADDAGCRGGG